MADLKGVNPAIQWTEKHLRDLLLRLDQLNQNTDEIESLLAQINSSIQSIGEGKTKTALLTGNQETAILNPSPGKRLRILGVALSQEPGSAECSLKFASSGIPILFISEKAGALFITCRIEGVVDEGVTAVVEDAAAGDRFFFLINYEEI